MALVAQAFAERVPAPQRRWAGIYPVSIMLAAVLCLALDVAVMARFDASISTIIGSAAALFAWAARRRSTACHRRAEELLVRLRRLDAKKKRGDVKANRRQPREEP